MHVDGMRVPLLCAKATRSNVDNWPYINNQILTHPTLLVKRKCFDCCRSHLWVIFRLLGLMKQGSVHKPTIPVRHCHLLNHLL